MRKTVLFIDFEDSFTYNVVQELTQVGFHVNVINWREWEGLPKEDVLALGPGPGHPDDYQVLFPLISEWLSLERPLFGVCLGHQIFWRLQGAEIKRSLRPLHGQKVEIVLNQEWCNWLRVSQYINVQRYNSLCVPASSKSHLSLKNLVWEEEILITRGKNVITYQFHPESVGTSFRSAFFRPLLKDFV